VDGVHGGGRVAAGFVLAAASAALAAALWFAALSAGDAWLGWTA
jgi:hypothetical protein